MHTFSTKDLAQNVEVCQLVRKKAPTDQSSNQGQWGLELGAFIAQHVYTTEGGYPGQHENNHFAFCKPNCLDAFPTSLEIPSLLICPC